MDIKISSPMKYFCFVFVFIVFFSCKKECPLPNYILKGKLKSWTEYTNVSDTNSEFTKFHFIYNINSGQLSKVEIGKKIDNIFYNGITTIHFTEINNNKIRVEYNQDSFYTRIFYIYTQGKQITKITELDTINNLENNSTTFIINNNQIDSIYDIGFDPSFNTDISLHKFQFQQENYSTYISDSKFNIPFPIPYTYSISDTFKLAYTSYVNTPFIRYQIPGCKAVDNSSILRLLVPLLSIDGYYFIKPNKNLIDSISYLNVTEKYNYIFTGSLITKMVFTQSNVNVPNLKTIINNDIEYY